MRSPEQPREQRGGAGDAARGEIHQKRRRHLGERPPLGQLSAKAVEKNDAHRHGALPTRVCCPCSREQAQALCREGMMRGYEW